MEILRFIVLNHEDAKKTKAAKKKHKMTERQKVNFLRCGLPACTRYTAGKMPAPQ